MMYARVTTAPVFGLRREIDRLFEDTFGHGQVGQNEWSPAVDIRETDTALTFAVELPGIKLENLEVTADQGVLTIHGEKTEDRKEGEENRYHLVERRYGSFTRRFQLPPGVDGDKIEADVENGMLEVHIPKTALPQPKRIQVQAGTDGRKLAPQALGTGEPRKESLKKMARAN
ncbi:MAG TPA: Hsp20/alpha crystallin family protein [Gemmatimonadaceae bacterium]|nr:Hsp20/alpha crystallin family protein [Gemmatimonadaceae bacterium]